MALATLQKSLLCFDHAAFEPAASRQQRSLVLAPRRRHRINPCRARSAGRCQRPIDYPQTLSAPASAKEPRGHYDQLVSATSRRPNSPGRDLRARSIRPVFEGQVQRCHDAVATIREDIWSILSASRRAHTGGSDFKCTIQDAVIHSPAEITAACPTTVTSSRWPRALIRKTQ